MGDCRNAPGPRWQGAGKQQQAHNVAHGRGSIDCEAVNDVA